MFQIFNNISHNNQALLKLIAKSCFTCWSKSMVIKVPSSDTSALGITLNQLPRAMEVVKYLDKQSCLRETTCKIDKLSTSVEIMSVNSSPPQQNGHHFADDIFSCIFVNEKNCILIKISLKFVPEGPTDNNPAFVQIMAWRQIGNKPLFEQVLTWFIDAYMRH